MEYEEKFKDILNENETILKTYKPNKLKYWVSKALGIFFIALLWAMLTLSLSYTSAGEGNAAETVFDVTNFAITLSVGVVVILLYTVYLIFFYRNLYYCVTNERIIIRRGVFGTDYKTLDMQMIGATNVHVSILDKIVRRNTGSIVFGSNSAPLVGQGSVFIFKDIVDPYNESKEIKSAIDNFRTKSKDDTKNSGDAK